MNELENLQQLKIRLIKLNIVLEVLGELTKYLDENILPDPVTFIKEQFQKVVEERQEIEAHINVLQIQKHGKNNPL